MSHEKAENRQIDFKGNISTHCFLTNVYALEKAHILAIFDKYLLFQFKSDSL
jgi:hypothetical protein